MRIKMKMTSKVSLKACSKEYYDMVKNDDKLKGLIVGRGPYHAYTSVLKRTRNLCSEQKLEFSTIFHLKIANYYSHEIAIYSPCRRLAVHFD